MEPVTFHGRANRYSSNRDPNRLRFGSGSGYRSTVPGRDEEEEEEEERVDGAVGTGRRQLVGGNVLPW